MNVQAALQWAKDKLKEAKSERPEETGNYTLDAQIILEHTLKKPRGFALIHPEAEITPEAEQSFLYDIERRATGVCTAYITGHKLFRNLDLFVNESVLVPRPDTETLVDAALELIDERQGGAPAPLKKPLKILDLGTGSGAIALSLWCERPGLEVDASDISESALEVARRNCAMYVGSREWGLGSGEQRANDFLRGGSLPLAPNLRFSATPSPRGRSPLKPPLSSQTAFPTPNFIQSELFQNISDSYDIIVSNPPYLPSKMIATLPPEVRGEPRLALDGGEDGLVLIRRIIKEAPAHLKPGGNLLLEAAPELIPQISKLFREGGFTNISIKKDLNGDDRVITSHL